jgi:hypothetical protein
MDGIGQAPTMPLRRAAAGVFALIAVLPLLLFAYALYSVEALGRPVAQVLLTLALGLVVVGFYLFKLLVARMGELMRASGLDALARDAAAARSFSLPLAGTLLQVTGDGLLLVDEAGQRVGVGYRRISAVEAGPAPTS